MKNRKLALLLAVIMVFSVFMTACGKDEVKKPEKTAAPEVSETPVPTAPPEPSETPEPTMLIAPPDPTAPPEVTPPEPVPYLDRLIFVGDANTYGLKYYNMLSGGSATTQVWTPTNGTLAMAGLRDELIYYPETGEEMSVAQAAAEKTPEYIVLSVGMGGIGSTDEASFKNEYKGLIESIQSASPETLIICNSIYPVEASYDEKDNGITNTAIDIANIWIAAVASETGTVYMDTASVLKGADGSLIPGYGTGDGVHIGPAGYTAVLSYLNEHQVFKTEG